MCEPDPDLLTDEFLSRVKQKLGPKSCNIMTEVIFEDDIWPSESGLQEEYYDCTPDLITETKTEIIDEFNCIKTALEEMKPEMEMKGWYARLHGDLGIPEQEFSSIDHEAWELWYYIASFYRFKNGYITKVRQAGHQEEDLIIECLSQNDYVKSMSRKAFYIGYEVENLKSELRLLRKGFFSVVALLTILFCITVFFAVN
jgi:hypothetical protein